MIFFNKKKLVSVLVVGDTLNNERLISHLHDIYKIKHLLWELISFLQILLSYLPFHNGHRLSPGTILELRKD